MVLNQFAFTAFQKGIERILGRGFGILVGLVLLMLFRNAWGLGFVFEALGLAAFFYVFFCNRLAYTFLNAGLYMAVIMEIGHARPAMAATEGWQMFMAVVVGVAVAYLVCWYTGAERNLSIQTHGDPLFPLDAGRVGQSITLAITVGMAQLLIGYFDLPATTTLVSVMLLTVAPDLTALLRKGELRLMGALLATVYAAFSLLLLVRMPHFPLLVVLLFLGMYLAAYLASSGGTWAYSGLQMGLVLPMILAVPGDEFGSLEAARHRIEGLVIALACSLLVGIVVASFGRAPRELQGE